MKIVVKNVECPRCNSPESHPTRSDCVLIRAFKVCSDDGYWWSQCLVCAGYYDKNLNETPSAFNKAKGWF